MPSEACAENRCQECPVTEWTTCGHACHLGTSRHGRRLSDVLSPPAPMPPVDPPAPAIPRAALWLDVLFYVAAVSITVGLVLSSWDLPTKVIVGGVIALMTSLKLAQLARE